MKGFRIVDGIVVPPASVEVQAALKGKTFSLKRAQTQNKARIFTETEVV